MSNTTRLTKLKSILTQFCSFIEPYRFILNNHNVQFLVDNHWQEFVEYDENLVENLEKINAENRNLLRYMLSNDGIESQNANFDSLAINLREVYRLWSSEVLTRVDDLKFSHENGQTFNDFELLKTNYINNMNVKSSDRFMTEKKTHEVDEMSFIIAKLCKYLNIDNIIDIGSGKGYLSTQLSYLYDLNVIAIDSSPVNVTSTMDRINKMKKQTNLNLKNFDDTGTKFKTFQELINVNTNLSKLVHQRVDVNLESKQYSLIGLHTCGELANSLIKLYLNNLATNMCLLCNVSCCYHFLNEKYSPQCYNFINLGDVGNTTGDNIARIGCGHSGITDLAFPMSSLLNQRSFYLGRNARMISSQPVDRYLAQDEIYDRGLWYRSVLQVILKEVYNLEGLNIKVGKLAPKCETFNIYVHKALNKLKLDATKLTDDDIASYWNRYLNEQNKFKIYFQFKLLFSPIVEYIILLDRLVYLIEETSATEQHSSYLVQLFDPLKSPRCYALISF